MNCRSHIIARNFGETGEEHYKNHTANKYTKCRAQLQHVHLQYNSCIYGSEIIAKERAERLYDPDYPRV